MAARRQPRRPARGLQAAALLLCLLELASTARAQGIFELLTGPSDTAISATPTAPTTAATPVISTPTTPTPTTTATTPATPTPTTTATPVTSTPTTTATPVTSTPTATPSAPTTATPTATPSVPATTTTPAPATTTTTPAPATTTTPAPATTTTPAPATTTTTPAPATTTTPAPATTTTTPAPVTTTTPITTTPSAPAVVNSNATAATPAVPTTPGADAAEVVDVGTVDTAVQDDTTDKLPPSPPEAWQALQKDCQLVFNLEIRGKYIVPFTSPKAAVIARVLRDRYLRSAQLPDISVAALNTFTYLSYDSPTDSADALPVDSSPAGGRRRLQRLHASASRDLLQLEKSGAELKIIVATAQVRVDSEIASMEDGVDSGSMARDFTLAGIDTENITMLLAPFTEDLIGPGNADDTGSTGMETWVIAVIVGVILLLLPVPLYLLVRWKKRKNKEAAAIAEAEAEAARQRMQSRMMRPGSKSFSLKPGSTADIMVRSGSIGGLAGYHNNGRLQSWSGSPERQYGQYSISRQTSVTSMGSAMPTSRSYGMPQRPPSLPGLPPGRSPYQQGGHMAVPNGAYEEELEVARSARSHRRSDP